MFEKGQRVKVSGRSKGKGFQGTIRRHDFSPRAGEPRLPQRPRARLDRRERDSLARDEGHAPAGPDGQQARDAARASRSWTSTADRNLLDRARRRSRPRRRARRGARWLSKPLPRRASCGAQGTVDLPAEIFAEPFHNAVVYEAARAEQLARRRGTAATRTRGEVSGGGAKPWRQKGTGRARAGSIRAAALDRAAASPSAPRPRDYTVKVNRKARRRALRAALSVHARRGSVAVIDAAAYEEPSTSRPCRR